MAFARHRPTMILEHWSHHEPAQPSDRETCRGWRTAGSVVPRSTIGAAQTWKTEGRRDPALPLVTRDERHVARRFGVEGRREVPQLGAPHVAGSEGGYDLGGTTDGPPGSTRCRPRILHGMVKVTYSLDDATVRRIRRTAERLGLPQSRAVREAVAEYDARTDRLSETERLRMLDLLDGWRKEQVARSREDVESELREIRRSRRDGWERRSRRQRTRRSGR